MKKRKKIFEVLDMIDDLRRKCILKKPTYDIPVRDTLGRKVLENSNFTKKFKNCIIN